MNQFTATLAKLLFPILQPASIWLLSEKRKHYTWIYEFIVAGAILFAVTIASTNWLSGKSIFLNIITAIAVFASFGHCKVTTRMTEEQDAQPEPSISCYKMAEHYWIIKEIAWFITFITSGMFSALVGNFLFLIYPAWRHIHVTTRQQVRKIVSNT